MAEAILTGIKVVAFSVKGVLAVCPVPFYWCHVMCSDESSFAM